ncbi:MAG: hypothetical protein ACJA1Y_001365 [Burkholderiaceae bacterium]|jgi:hypothetical protein
MTKPALLVARAICPGTLFKMNQRLDATGKQMVGACDLHARTMLNGFLA